MKKFAILLTIVLTGFSMSSTFDENKTWEQARQLYYKGLKHEEALNQAIELFQQLSSHSTEPGVAQTYLGSLTALKAQYTPWPTKKLKYANQGLEIMDAGLENNPDNLEALFIHGTTSYYLPFFFNRRDDAHRSFKRIIELLPQRIDQQDPELTNNILNFILENADLDDNEKQIAQQLKNKVDVG
jgi:hypothetical protein